MHWPKTKKMSKNPCTGVLKPLPIYQKLMVDNLTVIRPPILKLYYWESFNITGWVALGCEPKIPIQIPLYSTRTDSTRNFDRTSRSMIMSWRFHCVKYKANPWRWSSGCATCPPSRWNWSWSASRIASASHCKLAWASISSGNSSTARIAGSYILARSSSIWSRMRYYLSQ